MSIFIDENTKVIVQGITGRDGSFHTQGMIEDKTEIVGGVTPGRGGETVHGVPVFDSVAEARAATGANTSVIYVPAPFASDAIFEAVDAGIKLVVCITEGVPVNEMIEIYAYVERSSSRLIGPNCPGLISPGKSKVGILPGAIHRPGPVGVVSRSGTLTYQVVDYLARAEIGQSTCIGIGGDPIIGTNFLDVLERFEADPQTEAVVMIGEIGGTDEQEAARFIENSMSKPVVGFIAGRTAPPGKRMGHAGAIISGGGGTAREKTEALNEAGVPVAKIPSEIPGLVSRALGSTLT
jgi:succinyl-CoA synthetase alpha subunit